jgi:hypothetical protein
VIIFFEQMRIVDCWKLHQFLENPSASASPAWLLAVACGRPFREALCPYMKGSAACGMRAAPIKAPALQGGSDAVPAPPPQLEL